ncbi:unnamed protein product, partial [Nesidiocoris tenuis]
MLANGGSADVATLIVMLPGRDSDQKGIKRVRVAAVNLEKFRTFVNGITNSHFAQGPPSSRFNSRSSSPRSLHSGHDNRSPFRFSILGRSQYFHLLCKYGSKKRKIEDVIDVE